MENLGFEGKLGDGSVSGENIILFKKTMFFFFGKNISISQEFETKLNL
jgi:hypothetical protein